MFVAFLRLVLDGRTLVWRISYRIMCQTHDSQIFLHDVALHFSNMEIAVGLDAPSEIRVSEQSLHRGPWKLRS